MNTSNHFSTRQQAAETRALRHFADQLALPALCRVKACRRAQVCKGEPRDCLCRYAPLVPEDAREWVKAALAGLDKNETFEEVYADNREAFEAYVAWREAVTHAFGR